MRAPALFIETQTQVAIQVDAAFRALLAPELVANSVKVEVAFDLQDDSFDFLIDRQRDGMKACFKVAREAIYDGEVATCVAAFQYDREQLSKLILFLA